MRKFVRVCARGCVCVCVAGSAAIERMPRSTSWPVQSFLGGTTMILCKVRTLSQLLNAQ